MKSKFFGMVGVVILVFMLLGSLFPLAISVNANGANPIKPIIFVHGSGGSGAQFESDSMRFTSNGYPQNLLFAFEYDTGTPSTENMTERVLRLDTFVDTVLISTGADKVYLMGHSLGTYVSQTYLAVPARAAKVAKYVNIDGATAGALPGGVPTLALWATKGWSYNPANQIVGATNVFIPNQTHVQIATSAESFVEMYKFFLGTIPATSNILSESCDQIQLAGRAMLYPQGRGVGDATLDIWEVNGGTGARIGAVPKATYTLSGNGFYDGAWGPFTTRCGVQYEFVLYRAGLRPHHFYFEPFVRDNYFVRLLTSPPGGIGDLMERNMNSAALVITRNKEFWGDQGTNNDVLALNGTNVINAATCPLIKVPGSTGVIGIFAYDRYLNGLTDLSAPIPTFFAVGFMTGVDIYMPAADPPTGTISLVLTPRGGGGGTQVINMLNWASLNHSVSAPFNDYCQYTGPKSASVLTATGTGTATFTINIGSINNLTASATTPCGTLAGFNFPQGFFSFNITNITPGSTVTITITLPSNMPANTQYWKCINGQWVNCSSILGSNDGDNILTLTITDGGLGDADGLANGTIVDPGAPAVPVTTPANPHASPTLPTQLTLAQTSVKYLSINPQQASANQPVTISANVVNTGDNAGNYNVALKINGQVEQNKMVSVGPRTTQPVKFTVTKAQPGTYKVDIVGLEGSFIINGAGKAAGASMNGGLIAILIMGFLILVVAVVLLISRRPA
jgi:pimeloyl-ACP methyl ester carboxylesterase